jgi:hypothetical protein
MRTLAATACFTLAASFFVACSPNLGEGRVLCASSAPACPDGYSCVNGRCYRGAPDAGERDAPSDAGVDAAVDAPRLELCTPSAAGALPVDEDGDGRVDEGCGLQVDIVHPITDAVVARSALTFPRLSSDGRTLTYCRSQDGVREIMEATRRSLTERFGPAAPRTLDPVTPNPCAAQRHGEDLYYEATPSTGARVQRIYRERAESTSVVNVAESDGESVGHPFVSEDGRELFFEGRRGSMEGGRLFVMGLVDGEWRNRRAVVFADAPPNVLREMFPTLSPDGLTLFFVRMQMRAGRVERLAMMAQRTARSEASFGAPVELPMGLMQLGSFSPSFATWEVVASAADPRATAGNDFDRIPNEGLFRARLCAGECPARGEGTRLVCGAGATTSPDGLHCYKQGTGPAVTFAMARCPEGSGTTRGSLVSIHSAPEFASVIAAQQRSTEPWIGAEQHSGAWLWSSGEPATDLAITSVFWEAGEPSGSEACAVLSSSPPEPPAGSARNQDCGGTRVPLCELDLWPTW